MKVLLNPENKCLHLQGRDILIMKAIRKDVEAIAKLNRLGNKLSQFWKRISNK